MRNNITDMLGDGMDRRFHKSGLTLKKFIKQAVDVLNAFDITETTFHTFEHDDVISYYYNANRNQWFAKI